MINPAWDKIFKSREWGMEVAAPVLAYFTRQYYFSKRSEIKVLDLGCGCGANLWWLACEGYTVSGIDGSPTAIEKCKALIERLQPKATIDLRVGDLCALPYPDNHFDVVIDIVSASTNADMVAIYKEVTRVLRPDGVMLAQIFTDETNPICFAPDTVNMRLSKEQLGTLMTNSGLSKYGAYSRKRPFFAHEDAVCEWIVTAVK